MKRSIVLLLLSIALLAGIALAGHHSTPPAPTLIVSCVVCAPGEAISFQGSGYKPKARVQLAIEGPVSYTIVTDVDASGNISVYYGTVLSYDPGSYIVTASAMSGNTLTPLTQTSFTVQ